MIHDKAELRGLPAKEVEADYHAYLQTVTAEECDRCKGAGFTTSDNQQVREGFWEKWYPLGESWPLKDKRKIAKAKRAAESRGASQ